MPHSNYSWWQLIIEWKVLIAHATEGGFSIFGKHCDLMIICGSLHNSSLNLKSLTYRGYHNFVYNKGMSLQTKGLVIELREGNMGGSSNYMELDEIESYIKDSEALWVYLWEGGL